MKRCDNCFEDNSDGATNCVICGECLDVPQVDIVDDLPFAGQIAGDPFARGVDERAAEGAEAPDDGTIAVAEAEADEELAADRALEDQPPDVDPALSHDDADAAAVDDETSDEPVAMLDDEGWDDSSGGVDPSAGSAAVDVDDDVDPSVDDELELPQEDFSDSETVVEDVPTEVVPPLAASATGYQLQVYHDNDARVVHCHAVVNDITLIGREDPTRDIFPDLDLGKLGDEVSAKHVSRQHLRLLRQGDRFYLFVYKGSTGTQVCKDLIEPTQYGKRFEISVGDRIILGGKVRMKLAPLEEAS